MKKLILKWLGIDYLPDTSKKVLALETANDNRRQETSDLIEQMQNLDNNEVIRDLNNRIKKLESKGDE